VDLALDFFTVQPVRRRHGALAYDEGALHSTFNTKDRKHHPWLTGPRLPIACSESQQAPLMHFVSLPALLALFPPIDFNKRVFLSPRPGKVALFPARLALIRPG
jgi:hypothetical protein